MQVLHILLLVFIISCAVSVSLTKNLLTALVIFMGQSLAMSVIWILLESPDLAITEAAAAGDFPRALCAHVQLQQLRRARHNGG